MNKRSSYFIPLNCYRTTWVDIHYSDFASRIFYQYFLITERYQNNEYTINVNRPIKVITNGFLHRRDPTNQLF